MINITVNDKIYTIVRGWNPITPTLGCHYIKDVGARFYSKTRALVKLKVYNIDTSYQFEARGLCSIRPDTVALTQYVFSGTGPEDFRAGSAMGINPCGDPGSLHNHDAIMRRCPIGLYDMSSGRSLGVSNVDPAGYDLVRFSQIKGFEANQGLKPYDGQHLIRAYRIGLLLLRDPFVKMDLKAILLDAKIVWSPRATAILKGASGVGTGNTGREFAWVTYLAFILDDTVFLEKMKSVIKHIINPNTGLIQQLKNNEFWGSPHPWAVPPGGSGVPITTTVAQDIEACMCVMIFCKTGLIDEAKKLAATILSRPKRKWINFLTGEGEGLHYADTSHPWFALGALAQVAPEIAKQYALMWPVPKPTWMGGSNGPYKTLPEVKAALVKWEDPGKTRWMIEAL